MLNFFSLFCIYNTASSNTNVRELMKLSVLEPSPVID